MYKRYVENEGWKFRDIQWRTICRELRWGSFFVGILFGVGSAILVTQDPRNLSFELDDPRISYPIRGNTVPAIVVILVPLAVWFIQSMLLEFWYLKRLNGNISIAMFAMFNSLLRIVEQFLAVVFVQQAFATLSGQLRPDFLAQCQPNDLLECTNPNTHAVRDARKSYFSGHTSSPFSLIVFLMLDLIYAMYYRRHQLKNLLIESGEETHENEMVWWKMDLIDAATFFWIATSLTLSALVGMSRVIDNKHAREDVATGMFIGALFAIVFFPRYLFIAEVGLRKLRPNYPTLLPHHPDNFVEESDPVKDSNPPNDQSIEHESV
mmetsp:Transcript_6438/g.11463  ORF Transcript_6438/g.11463 Transcript_6438/m.11463 type:complete len:322 (-) Transcript_6438:1495-2460(-)